MKRQRERRGPLEWILLCAAALWTGFLAGAADLRATDGTPGSTTLFVARFAAMLCLAPLLCRLLRGHGWFRRGTAARYLAVLLAAGVLPRLAWWLWMPPRVISDYELYVNLGRHFAETGGIPEGNYLPAVAPNAAFFAAFAGTLMRVFGRSAGTIQWAVMVLHTANVLLVYGIGAKLTERSRAFAAALVFALLPENVFYSNLPGTEAPAMFTMLAGLLAVLCVPGKQKPAAAALCGGAGALLAVSVCFRANAWIVIVTAGILLALGNGEKTPVPRRALLTAVFLLGAAAVLLWHQGFRGAVFTGEKPAGGIGWTLYEGLDLENGGKWSAEKSARCIEVIDAHSPEEADRIFLSEALERFRGYTAGEKARMFLRKGGSVWYDSRYSILSTEGRNDWPRFCFLVNDSWLACMAAWVYCLAFRGLRPLRGKGRRACALLLAPVLATAAWHEAATSIGRYHYMMIPFILLFIFTALPCGKKLSLGGKEADGPDGVHCPAGDGAH